MSKSPTANARFRRKSGAAYLDASCDFRPQAAMALAPPPRTPLGLFYPSRDGLHPGRHLQAAPKATRPHPRRGCTTALPPVGSSPPRARRRRSAFQIVSSRPTPTGTGFRSSSCTPVETCKPFRSLSAPQRRRRIGPARPAIESLSTVPRPASGSVNDFGPVGCGTRSRRSTHLFPCMAKNRRVG